MAKPQSGGSWKGGTPLLLLLLTLLLLPGGNVRTAAAARPLLAEPDTSPKPTSSSSSARDRLSGSVGFPDPSPSEGRDPFSLGDRSSVSDAILASSRGEGSLPTGIIAPKDTPPVGTVSDSQQPSAQLPVPQDPSQYTPTIKINFTTATAITEQLADEYQKASTAAAGQAPEGVAAAENGDTVGKMPAVPDTAATDTAADPADNPISTGGSLPLSGSGERSGGQPVDVCACNQFDALSFDTEPQRKDACAGVSGCSYVAPGAEPWQMGWPSGNCTGRLC